MTETVYALLGPLYKKGLLIPVVDDRLLSVSPPSSVTRSAIV